MDATTLTGIGIPVLLILVAGALVWITTQICKAAIRNKKQIYLLYAALGSLAVAYLVVVTATQPPFSWKTFAWVTFGGWIMANIGHKFYAKYLQKYFETEYPYGDNGAIPGV